MDRLIEKVELWAIERNIENGDPKIQLCKTLEELGEFAKAVNKNDKIGQIDGLGDTLVTLIIVAMQLKLDVKECLNYAYNEIKYRKGKTIGGVFIKEEDLK